MNAQAALPLDLPDPNSPVLHAAAWSSDHVFKTNARRAPPRRARCFGVRERPRGLCSSRVAGSWRRFQHVLADESPSQSCVRSPRVGRERRGRLPRAAYRRGGCSERRFLTSSRSGALDDDFDDAQLLPPNARSRERLSAASCATAAAPPLQVHCRRPAGLSAAACRSRPRTSRPAREGHAWNSRWCLPRRWRTTGP